MHIICISSLLVFKMFNFMYKIWERKSMKITGLTGKKFQSPFNYIHPWANIRFIVNDYRAFICHQPYVMERRWKDLLHQLPTTKSWEKIIGPVGNNSKPYCHLGQTKISILYIDPPLLGLQKCQFPSITREHYVTNELEE